MVHDIRFDRRFDPRHGQAVTVGPAVVRLTAPNPGPFTFHGTNTYVVGAGSVVVVDPGPDDARHLAALAEAIDGRRVDAILLTHTHRDHTGLVETLKAAVHAPVLAEGRHRPARPLLGGETNLMDAAGDAAIVPDRLIADGEWLDLPAARMECVATPGHTANHMAYTIAGTGILLSGDHVMAWSTTVIAPPDGSMASYMGSLDRLLARDDALYLPGHGGPVTRPRQFVRALRSHRRMREAAILDRLKAGDRTIAEIVDAVYREVDRSLVGAARLNVFAHLEDLVARGRANSEGPPMIDSRYEAA